ncbi:MAG: hypothetical protein N2450_01985 [bacterium]|nr:hypothetical protein [bacterium]
MSKKKEYEKLLEIARTRFKKVQHQTGDFRGGAYISPDGKSLVINQSLPLDERIDILIQVLNQRTTIL